MRIKTTLKTLITLMFIVSLLPAVAPAKKTKWNFAIQGQRRAFTEGLEAAKIMLEKADPNFELNIVYGNALSPAKQNLDGLKIGAFEAAFMFAAYHPGKLPMTMVLELPFLLPTDHTKKNKVETEIKKHPIIRDELRSRWNAMFFLNAFLPPYELMGNKRIASVKDFKGVKVRLSGPNAKILQMFGAVPTMVPAPEAYEAVDRGMIDVFGLPYTYALGAYRVYEVSKYTTEGLAMGGGSVMMLMSVDAWNSWNPKLQKMLPAVRKHNDEVLIAAYVKADKKWRPIFDKRLEIVPFPASERAKLIAKAKPVWDKWEKDNNKKGFPATKILNHAKAMAKKYG